MLSSCDLVAVAEILRLRRKQNRRRHSVLVEDIFVFVVINAFTIGSVSSTGGGGGGSSARVVRQSNVVFIGHEQHLSATQTTKVRYTLPVLTAGEHG